MCCAGCAAEWSTAIANDLLLPCKAACAASCLLLRCWQHRLSVLLAVGSLSTLINSRPAKGQVLIPIRTLAHLF